MINDQETLKCHGIADMSPQSTLRWSGLKIRMEQMFPTRLVLEPSFILTILPAHPWFDHQDNLPVQYLTTTGYVTCCKLHVSRYSKNVSNGNWISLYFEWTYLIYVSLSLFWELMDKCHIFQVFFLLFHQCVHPLEAEHQIPAMI